MNKFIYIFSLLFLTIYSLETQTCRAQWNQVFNIESQTRGVNSFVSIGNNVFAGTDSNLYLSTNNGVNWSQIPINGVSGGMIYSLLVNGISIYAGAYTNQFGVFLSTNNGTSWNQIGQFSKIVKSLAINGNNIFVGTYGDGIYRSTNNGLNWEPVGLNGLNVLSMVSSGNYIFAGTYNYPSGSGGVYRTTNNGVNWIQTGLNNEYIRSLAVNGYNIFAGTSSNGVFISTNNGVNWSQTSLNNKSVFSIALSGNSIFAGAGIEGIYFSSNNGTNWIMKNQGFIQSPSINALLIANNYIFAGAFSFSSIWRRSYLEAIGINRISLELPIECLLKQNYPNPFNPTTNIRYEISKNSFMKLIVYDAIGREIECLVNEKQSPGTYEVTFDASAYPSGIYYYKLESSNFVQTNKMILLK